MYGSGLESATSKVACSLERQQGGGWHDCWAPRPGAPWLLLPLLALGCSWAVASSAPASSLCGKAPALSAGHRAMEAGRVRGSRGNPLVLWVLLHPYGFWFLCPPAPHAEFLLKTSLSELYPLQAPCRCQGNVLCTNFHNGICPQLHSPGSFRVVVPCRSL